MMRALYTGATGMISEQTNVDTIANNLANVNTTGYKAERTEFKSLLYQTLQSKTTTANGEPKPVGAQVGLGTRVASNTSVYTQGSLNSTEKLTDFALDGDGFFAVRGADGETYYTRNGNFTWSLDANNNIILATQEGYPVLGSDGNVIQVPQNLSAEAMVFTDEGQIGYKNVGGNVTLTNQYFGLYQFNNPAGLEKIGQSLLTQTEASGVAMSELTNANLERSKVVQGYLEGSNVSVADEMVNLIIAQRAYEMNSKVITTSDAMLETANNLKR